MRLQPIWRRRRRSRSRRRLFEIPPRRAARRLAFSAAALAIALGAIALWLHWSVRPSPGPKTEITLAVAPFDVSGNAAAQFAESFRMDLVDGLSAMPGIRVSAAHSLVPGERVAAGHDGRRLGVTAILYTQFSKTNDLIDLHVELVRADDATHLYAWNYSGNSRSAGNHPRFRCWPTSTATGAVRRRPTSRISAKPATRQRMSCICAPAIRRGLRSDEGMTAAIQDYRQAIQRDPRFARAYSGLAYATYALSPTNAGYQQAETSALRAVALAPNLADAHAVLGNIYFHHDWRFNEGVKQMQQAIALDPNDADYHMWLGFMWGNLGRFQEDSDQMALAQKDDPLWAPVYANEVNLGFISKRFGQMWKAVDALNAIKPGSYIAYHTSAWANWEAGRYREAILDWRQADRQAGDEDGVTLQERGLAALDAGGPKAYARLRLALALQYQKEGNSSSEYLAPEWAAYAGDKALCLSELKQMVDRRDANSIQMAVISRLRLSAPRSAISCACPAGRSAAAARCAAGSRAGSAISNGSKSLDSAAEEFGVEVADGVRDQVQSYGFHQYTRSIQAPALPVSGNTVLLPDRPHRRRRPAAVR